MAYRFGHNGNVGTGTLVYVAKNFRTKGHRFAFKGNPKQRGAGKGAGGNQKKPRVRFFFFFFAFFLLWGGGKGAKLWGGKRPGDGSWIPRTCETLKTGGGGGRRGKSVLDRRPNAIFRI